MLLMHITTESCVMRSLIFEFKSQLRTQTGVRKEYQQRLGFFTFI